MFGIGATKAGTSWLYRFLDAHPDCAMPMVKELHYFDTVEFGTNAGALKSVEAGIEGARAKLRKGVRRSIRAKHLRSRIAAFQELHQLLTAGREVPEAYLGYLNRQADSAALVADITPAYALLPEARLRQMAAMTPDVRFVYLLRDPVDRLWSNLRMMATRLAETASAIPRIARALAQKVLNGTEQEASRRSDYAATLARLDRAVAPEALFVGFYETLFSPETTENLCRFLGIAPRTGTPDKKVHGGVAIPLDETLQVALARHLAPQYAAVEARFGVLPDAWQQNLAKVR